MRKSDKLKHMTKLNILTESRVSVLKEGAVDGKFSDKKGMVNALYTILKTEGVENRYTDEHWEGVNKLVGVFNKYGINYDLIKSGYEHNNDDFNSTLPNSKVYVFNITVMSKMGKEVVLPLKVNCAFVGKSGTMTDATYELTYYFMV